MNRQSLSVIVEVSVGSPIGQCRAVPVCLGPGTPRAILAVYAADFDVDPFHESDRKASPRVALFDDKGDRVWGDVEEGHMDMGWVARLGDGGRPIATAIRIGHKTCGPDGRFHADMTEFAFDALTGEPIDLGFSTYRTIPVDLDGDGYHEMVGGRPSGDGKVLDRHSTAIADVGAPVAMACKLLDLPGEQLLAYYPDGVLRIWGDANAEDGDTALARYDHPFYQANRRLTSTGSNLAVLGGI